MLGLALPRQQVEGLLQSPRKPAVALTYGGVGRNRTEALKLARRWGFAGPVLTLEAAAGGVVKEGGGSGVAALRRECERISATEG